MLQFTVRLENPQDPSHEGLISFAGETTEEKGVEPPRGLGEKFGENVCQHILAVDTQQGDTEQTHESRQRSQRHALRPRNMANLFRGATFQGELARVVVLTQDHGGKNACGRGEEQGERHKFLSDAPLGTHYLCFRSGGSDAPLFCRQTTGPSLSTGPSRIPKSHWYSSRSSCWTQSQRQRDQR